MTLTLARQKLAALRIVVEGNMHRNQWLALALLDGVVAALPEPAPEEIEEAYVERHVCTVIPFPRGPSSMTRDLLLPEPP